MTTRNGKIARLPKQIRHDLNGRLEDGQPGKQLVEWLNGLPEVQEVLKLRFGGRPISEQNLKAVGQLRRDDHQAARLLLDQARWEREALRLDQENWERAQKEVQRRASAPLLEALRAASLAQVFGPGEPGCRLASMPPQSSAPVQPNQTESNPIKPDQTPPPDREASPQAQPDHQNLNLDLAPSTRPNRNQSPPQSAAPIQPNQTQSNRIKPHRLPGNAPPNSLNRDGNQSQGD